MNEDPNFREEEEKQARSDDEGDLLAIAMCIGISIGVALGAVTHNYGLWIPVGTSIGATVGALLDVFRGKDEKDDDEEGNDEP